MQLDGDIGGGHVIYVPIDDRQDRSDVVPILTFFAQGFEHSVVNMFVIPAGMIVGAPVSFSDWWLWNQIPVTLGNILGGFVFTRLALYLTYKRAPAIAETKPVSSVVDFGAAVGR